MEYNPKVRWDYRVGKYELGVCVICGTKFQPTYGVSNFYCSNACKQKAYRQRKKRNQQALRHSMASQQSNA